MNLSYLTENYFSVLINNNPDLICRYNLDKRIEFINNTVTKVRGLPPEYYIGKSIFEFGYTPEFVEKFSQTFDRCVGDKQNIQIEMLFQKEDYPIKIFLITFVPIFDTILGTEVIGVFSVSRDITKEKNLEIELQKQLEEHKILAQRIIKKANKLQNFSYIVSHNLRSPLASIVGLMELYDAVKEEDREEIIGMLRLSVERLSQTVIDLTEAIQINQTFDLKIETVNLKKLLTHIQESLYLTIQETQTSFEVDFSACEEIHYHKVYMESILQNLITNAIKYRHPNRKPIIQLKTMILENGVLLTCQDNGIGIDLERHKHKIFGLHKTFHGNQDARGVGLFITKNQIEAMGGTIDVESELGEGTKFTIFFSL